MYAYFHPQMNMNSYVRVLHASPDAPPVDIYANGDMIVQNLAYKEITNYLPVMPGSYNIKVYPAGQKMNPVIDANVRVEPQSSYTLAASGMLENILLLPIVEPYVNMMNSGKSYIRFVHLSPNAPPVDITLPDGTVIFRNAAFKDVTEYMAVDPGMYTLQVRPTGSMQVVLTVPDVKLYPDMVYTVYAVGLVGEMPRLEALLETDGVNM